MVNPLSAATAYANTAARATGPKALGPTEGASFGEVLEQAAHSAIGTMQKSETMSAQAAIGKADLNDVVQAVTNAEVTLQTVTAVRDKVLNAYQEILRMPM
ncbi:flagellar hook-basal body complex protein FliE [Azospirillum agricola]|uniref:flagellar hook-basal body complex protein FliE n=1 Tax=Azospirillum agricola TaxID=1720247 RepID=UPI000A0F2B4D|nr:flagellar hook-basal body complex protein FliE [Azospirillum agricola]MBP2229325.1 flagellar hook-basal body complex protein FliE [Azospirillum agricola]SMH60393.1 flagellar hook-basal body complex protein FliE [Azospirillum lipoferum]